MGKENPNNSNGLTRGTFYLGESPDTFIGHVAEYLANQFSNLKIKRGEIGAQDQDVEINTFIQLHDKCHPSFKNLGLNQAFQISDDGGITFHEIIVPVRQAACRKHNVSSLPFADASVHIQSDGIIGEYRSKKAK